MKMSIKYAESLISHLKDDYKNWYKNLPKSEREQTNNWIEFVKQSAKVNYMNDGSEDDFVFTAEDAMLHLD